MDDDGLIYADVFHEQNEHPADKPFEKPTKSEEPTVYASIALEAMKIVQEKKKQDTAKSEESDRMPSFYVNYSTPPSPGDNSFRLSKRWDEAVFDYFWTFGFIPKS